MAGEVKLGAKTLNSIAETLSEIPIDKREAAAAKLGFDVDALNQVIANPKAKGAKALLTNVAEKLGGGIEATQEFVNQVLGRAKTDLEMVGAKAAQGGKVPPAVQPAFRAESLGKERGYTTQPPIGGPIVPAPQSKALQTAQKTPSFYPSETVDAATGAPMSSQTAVVPYGSAFDRPTAAQAEVAGAAAQAKPGPAGRGVSEMTPEAKTPRAEGYRTEAERAADLGLSMDMNLTPEARRAAKYGLGLGGVAAAGLGAKALLEQKPFAVNPEAQQAAPTVAIAGTDTPEKVNSVVDNAVSAGGLTGEQGEQVKQQVQTLEQVLEAAQAKLGKKLDQDRARIEFYQLLDKVVDGVASMIGANALMNKNLPYALDFSKGPQIDWNARLASVTKEYQTGVANLMSKYKIEKTAEMAQARAAERKLEKEEERAFRQEMQTERLAAERQAAEQKQITKAEETAEGKAAKLSASVALALDETIAPGRLLTEKKNLITLGIDQFGKDEINSMIKKATEGVEGDRNVLRQLGVSWDALWGADEKLNAKEQQAVTKKFAELLNERMTKQALGQAPAAESPDLQAKRARLEELKRKAATGGQ